jgi:transcription elongation factor GreA-like protein
MNNGVNDWDVGYGSITFFEQMLRGHKNVAQSVRSRDILFAITRKNPADCVHVVIVNPYTLGVAGFYKVREEFPEVTCIVFAGDWNAYTLEAKELADAEGIGLLMPRELVAALFREAPHKYFTKDRHGNPVYYIRAA